MLQLASKYCIVGLVALCEKIIKAYVDYDNVAPIFHICARYQASQLLAYCAYFARKFEPHLCDSLTPETAPQLYALARELNLLDLKKVAEPLVVEELDMSEEQNERGCGESKQGQSKILQQKLRTLLHRPRAPPPIVTRERMWSA